MKKIIITVELNEELSNLTDEEIGYVGEFMKDQLECLRDNKYDEMEGTGNITFEIK